MDQDELLQTDLKLSLRTLRVADNLTPHFLRWGWQEVDPLNWRSPSPEMTTLTFPGNSLMTHHYGENLTIIAVPLLFVPGKQHLRDYTYDLKESKSYYYC